MKFFHLVLHFVPYLILNISRENGTTVTSSPHTANHCVHAASPSSAHTSQTFLAELIDRPFSLWLLLFQEAVAVVAAAASHCSHHKMFCSSYFFDIILAFCMHIICSIWLPIKDGGGTLEFNTVVYRIT